MAKLPKLSPILLRPKPSLFIAVREQAQAHALSMPVYILALLTRETGLDSNIFDKTPDEIQQEVRG